MFQKMIVLCSVGLMLLSTNCAHAQAVKKQATTGAKPIGHNIEITVKPYKNTKIYLGTNYGQNRVLGDSTQKGAHREVFIL